MYETIGADWEKTTGTGSTQGKEEEGFKTERKEQRQRKE